MFTSEESTEEDRNTNFDIETSDADHGVSKVYC